MEKWWMLKNRRGKGVKLQPSGDKVNIRPSLRDNREVASKRAFSEGTLNPERHNILTKRKLVLL